MFCMRYKHVIFQQAPVHATSHGDSSSDDETTSIGERVARVLQSHFNHGVDDSQ